MISLVIFVMPETSFNSIVSDYEHEYSITLETSAYLDLYVIKEFYELLYAVRALVKKREEVA